jgi:hypothetical protein
LPDDLTRLLIIMGLLTGLILVGCEEEESPDYGKYAPAKTIRDLNLAYNFRDAELLAGLFDEGDFELVAGTPPEGFPAEWSYDEETAATEAIFEDAYSITFEMVSDDAYVGKARVDNDEYVTPWLDTRIRVYPDEYKALYARGRVRFTLRRGGPDEEWKIIRTEDYTGPEYADVLEKSDTELTSWTGIKLLYLRKNAPEKDAE